ncbi:MAG TPA: hypothetical protein VI547_06020 [Anaerolineales bacterium]|nr:hypothetical protein [Anaerolineales bacterium]
MCGVVCKKLEPKFAAYPMGSHHPTYGQILWFGLGRPVAIAPPDG